MRRRDFLSAALVAPAVFRSAGRAEAPARTFEITTRIELDAAGPSRAWVPLPLARDSIYQRDRGHTIDGNASRTRVERVDGASMVAAEWRGGKPRSAASAATASIQRHSVTRSPHANCDLRHQLPVDRVRGPQQCTQPRSSFLYQGITIPVWYWA